MDVTKVNEILGEVVEGLAKAPWEGTVTGSAKGVSKVGSEKAAKALAKQKGLSYGHSAFGGGWYVGKPKELKKIGVMIKEDVEMDEALWSGEVKTKWHPPEGFFKQSAGKIASGLKSASKDLKQAMSRLNFYVNRGGENLTGKDMKRLNSAKKKLQKLYA